MQDSCPANHKPVFERDFLYEKHVNYLLKSLKKSTFGAPPDVAEAHQLSALFFVVSGLDLLGALDTRLTATDKQEVINWIYEHQVDVNKIKIYPSHDEDDHDHDHEPRLINGSDNGNSSAAAAAASLRNGNGNGAHLDRRLGFAGFRATGMINSDIPFDSGVISMTYCALATLVILGDDLKRVDRASIISGMRFLQLPNGSFVPSVLGGESDMRLVYCAVAVSYLLDDWSGMDRDKCASFIRDCLSYEGAFAQCQGAEAHGGSTYCALASLKLMSKLDETLSRSDQQRLARWCIQRMDNGFSGRPNKDEDTCYSLWIGACLVMLDSYQLFDHRNLLEFLLLSQEERGGLSKVPAFYSDPLHTYLGLAGLTFIDKELCAQRNINLRNIEPTLMITMRAKKHLTQLNRN